MKKLVLPKNLPGYLDPPTLAWVEKQFDEVVSFWRTQIIARPNDVVAKVCYEQTKTQLFYLGSVKRAAEANLMEKMGPTLIEKTDPISMTEGGKE